MKVILLEDIRGTGKKGDLINASDGYARNYLIPKKLAKEATSQALNELKNAEKAKQHKIELEREAALKIRDKVDGKSVKLYAVSGKGGKLFGSITSKEIAEQINKIYEVDIDKRKIKISSDIKAFGTYECEIKLHNKITAKVFATVLEKE